MNISYRWLQSLVPSLTESPRSLADRLGMLGAPVDELLDLGAGISDVVIARVDEVRPHPNADKLRLCSVDAGGGERLQVVCGAPNVEAGRFYPFAPIGATLPGGIAIKKAKLRGEVSEGMLCSARELGLGRDHTGLMTLAGEWEPGAPLVPRLGLDDARLVVDITPNRPDLLSHLGIAREVAELGVEDVRLAPFSEGGEPPLEIRRAEREGEVGGVRVSIEDADGCPRYTAAVVRGVRVGPSPEWLATRLRAAGLRPINNVVDATNYVLHEVGQPLHAFDLHRLAGGGAGTPGVAAERPEIRVRRARGGESLRTLDGVERELDEEMLVIADAERPVALAGIMGGEESEVTAGTTDVLVECALFDERVTRRTARRLGLSTDASYRFERGVDPELQPLALRRVVDLIVAVAGGEAEPAALDVAPRAVEHRVLPLRSGRVAKLLGVEVTPREIADLLRPIGFQVENGDGSLRVRVPGFRPDVEREVDLIEEIARRRGYDSFPETLGAYRPSQVPQDPMVPVQRRIQELLARWGALEARTVTFAPESAERVPLLNPLSAEESHLRDRLTPGLLRRVEHNWAHGVRDVRLYEIGTVFFPSAGGSLPGEEIRAAVVLTGARRPGHWSGEAPAWDLWDLKALLGELGRELSLGEVRVDDAEADGAAPWLEPRERFALRGADGRSVGWGGRVSARAVDAPAWAEPVWALEVVLPAAPAVRPAARFEPLPEFPAVERDLALLVPVERAAAEVEAVIRESAGELLQEVRPFDLYAGKGIPEGTRSVAWRLRFRLPERTLTDAEVDRALGRVLPALEEQLGVRLR
jgi:phenylalanyl-tRNA synthetase beta chain